jgi:TerC family integral membrane protein
MKSARLERRLDHDGVVVQRPDLLSVGKPGSQQHLHEYRSIAGVSHRYLIEKALSVDNVFVFLMIFAYFKVPAMYQHKVLFWGIIGALVMRAICIAAGVTLLKQFHWLIYVFGAFLIITGIKMAITKDKKIDPEKNPVLKAFRRMMPVTPNFVGDKFFTKIDGRRWATPLFIVLLFIEMTDLIFAVDSIPAILAITRDPFIVYTSNVFAILGCAPVFCACRHHAVVPLPALRACRLFWCSSAARWCSPMWWAKCRSAFRWALWPAC